MFYALNYSFNKSELKVISDIEDESASEFGEKCISYSFMNKESVSRFIATKPDLDIICIDIDEDRNMEFVELLRSMYRKSYLLLITDMKREPTDYVKSSIIPSELLIKPLDKKEIYVRIKRVIETYLENYDELIINRKYEIIKVPLNKIIFIEASSKKIILRTFDEDIIFYDTIERLEKRLQGTFIRTHRSFLVNKMYFNKILLSENVIEMCNNIYVPISRHYKELIKDEIMG